MSVPEVRLNIPQNAPVAKSPTFWEKYNPYALVGRVCANWRESANIALTVALVTACFLAFLSGQFITSLICGLAAAYNSIMLHEYRRLLNVEQSFIELKIVHNQLRDTAWSLQHNVNRQAEENETHLQNNKAQGEQIDKLTKQVSTFTEQMTVVQSSHKKHIDILSSLDKQIASGATDIAGAVKDAKEAMEENFDKQKVLVETFITEGNEARAALLEQAMTNKNITSQTLDMLTKLQKDVEERKVEKEQLNHAIQARMDACTRQEDALKKAQEEYSETVKMLTETREELAAERKELEDTRAQLKQASKELQEVTRETKEATKENLEAQEGLRTAVHAHAEAKRRSTSFKYSPDRNKPAGT